MEKTITYFDKPGKDNTDTALALVKKRAAELGIKTIVVASTRGDTAVKAMEMMPGLKVIAVSHAANYESPNTQEFTEANRKLVESRGGKVLTMTHLFSGLSRAVRKQFGTYELGDIMANTLRIMGEGFKVVVEIAIMSADAGLVRVDEDVISCAGTGHGADTAVVLTPVPSNSFFALKIKEIICKPRF